METLFKLVESVPGALIAVVIVAALLLHLAALPARRQRRAMENWWRDVHQRRPRS